MNEQMEAAWGRVCLAFGQPVEVVLVDAGPYDPDVGTPGTHETSVHTSVLSGPVRWKAIESGAAKQGDRFFQVRRRDLPRDLRPGDRIKFGDTVWTVGNVELLGPIVEAIAGRA